MAHTHSQAHWSIVLHLQAAVRGAGRIPLQLLTKWKDPPLSISIEPLHKSSPSPPRARIWGRDAICSWMGNFWLQKGWTQLQQHRGSPYLHLLLLLQECWAWSSCRTIPSANRSHGNETFRLLDQGNNCWGLINAKLPSSSNSNIPQFPFCLSSSSHLSFSI